LTNVTAGVFPNVSVPITRDSYFKELLVRVDNWDVVMRRGSTAFTLVELLVVIAIIGLLASLVLPGLSTAQFQARNTACKNNLRQMGLAASIYTTTYGEYPPRFAPMSGLPDVAFDWDQLLEKVLFPNRRVEPWRSSEGFYSRTPREDSFLCPFLVTTWPQAKQLNPYPQASQYNYNKYGVTGNGSPSPYLGLCGPIGNYSKGEPNRGKPESAIVAPSDMVAFGDPFSRSLNTKGDGFHRMFDWRPFPDVAPYIPYNGYAAKSAEAAKKHRHRFNKVFCDGHVETENFRKPFEASDDYLQRWNNDNQPHRDLWHPI
jgi:prepilin-type N-terminal cleavage/methylation domain-containing protein/prepilin-type processing-associated H-X9-DG protein